MKHLKRMDDGDPDRMDNSLPYLYNIFIVHSMALLGMLAASALVTHLSGCQLFCFFAVVVSSGFKIQLVRVSNRVLTSNV
jgi:hypothetical protein